MYARLGFDQIKKHKNIENIYETNEGSDSAEDSLEASGADLGNSGTDALGNVHVGVVVNAEVSLVSLEACLTLLVGKFAIVVGVAGLDGVIDLIGLGSVVQDVTGDGSSGGSPGSLGDPSVEEELVAESSLLGLGHSSLVHAPGDFSVVESLAVVFITRSEDLLGSPLVLLFGGESDGSGGGNENFEHLV